MTTHHCVIDIGNGIIRHARAPRNLDSMLKDAATGRSLSGEEVLQRAFELSAKGFEVMPIGCDNFDAKGYCLGHQQEAAKQ